MNRRQVDVAVGLLVAALVFAGALVSWQAGIQQGATGGMMDGSMMDGSTGTTGLAPIWYFLGSIFAAIVVAGFYLAVRPKGGAEREPVARERTLTPDSTGDSGTDPTATDPRSTAGTQTSAETPVDRSTPNGTEATNTPPPEPNEGTDHQEVDSKQDVATAPEATPRSRVLDLLPEDERRVLEPVLSSPGLTQIELRDRSEYSKSKVSQTVSGLEERGLLYRERQGRTYRLYPSDELADDGQRSTDP